MLSGIFKRIIGGRIMKFSIRQMINMDEFHYWLYNYCLAIRGGPNGPRWAMCKSMIKIRTPRSESISELLVVDMYTNF